MKNTTWVSKFDPLLLSVIVSFLWTANTFAQTNVWTKSSSGFWEEPFWSLGGLPGTNQTILFTNAWQALAISTNTVQSHPESLTVASVILSAPTNTANQLLMNFAGLQRPLQVGGSDFLGSMIIDTNSIVEMHSSALQINNAFQTGGSERGAFTIGGVFNQSDFSQVTAGFVHVGLIGPGVYNLTNGLATLGTEFIGLNFPGTFNQFGGTNAGTAQMESQGEYDLFGGVFTGTAIFNNGNFKQSGGSFSGGLVFDNGSYTLSGGTLNTVGLEIPSLGGGFFTSGQFFQNGGTNVCGGNLLVYGVASSIGEHIGSYTFSNGVLRVSGTEQLTQWGAFTQTGGVQTNARISLAGSQDRHGIQLAAFNFSGGQIMTAGLFVNLGTFTQTGGTNQVAGPVSVISGDDGSITYQLSGGVLTDASVAIQQSRGGGFVQDGGRHDVNGLLTVSQSGPAPCGYALTAGTLNAPNIKLDNGGAFHHLGGTVNNPGSINFNSGSWEEQTSAQQFGQMILTVANNGGWSTLVMPGGPCVLHFADSSSAAWAANGLLVVAGWNGSLNGNGNQQIIIGNNAAGLTAQQVAEIAFDNPPGVPAGRYAARILSSGEVVAAPGVPLRPTGLQAAVVSSNRIDLAWTDNSPNEVSFNLERGLDGTNFTQIASVSPNTTAYSDSGLAQSTTYYYRVRAGGTSGYSGYSEIVSATTYAFGRLPWPPWANTDIGPAGVAGNTLYYDGAFHLIGSGKDIFDFADSGQFAYQDWFGDGEIIARITRLDNTDPWAKAGVMFRSSTLDYANNAFMLLTAAQGAGFQSRTNYGNTLFTGNNFTGLGWVKLTRIGDLFTGYVSGNGTNWTLVGSQTIHMDDPIGVGLAFTSHNNSVLGEADFYVRVDSPGSASNPPMLTSCSRATNGLTQLVIQGDIGRFCGAEFSSNLMTWTNLDARFNETGTVTITDPDAPNHHFRFYRGYVAP